MMEDSLPVEYCDCAACKMLLAMDALADRVLALRRACGVVDRFVKRPWPRQHKGCCRSSERLEWMYRMTQPIRGRIPEEGEHGQAQATAAQAVQCYPNDHDDDDDV